MDLKEIGWKGVEWMDGEKWLAVVNTVMNLRVL
jgi:hypothetical protein